jgi:hypothetical protein
LVSSGFFVESAGAGVADLEGVLLVPQPIVDPITPASTSNANSFFTVRPSFLEDVPNLDFRVST